MVVIKFNGRWVQVVRFARTVQFSSDTDWFMVCSDWEVAFRKRQQFRWVPASTRFDDVREFV